MSDLTITPITVASIRKLWRKWCNERALRASQRNAEVLTDYIHLYQQELTREHRKQVYLSNAIKAVE